MNEKEWENREVQSTQVFLKDRGWAILILHHLQLQYVHYVCSYLGISHKHKGKGNEVTHYTFICINVKEKAVCSRYNGGFVPRMHIFSYTLCTHIKHLIPGANDCLWSGKLKFDRMCECRCGTGLSPVGWMKVGVIRSFSPALPSLDPAHSYALLAYVASVTHLSRNQQVQFKWYTAAAGTATELGHTHKLTLCGLLCAEQTLMST